MIFQKAQELKIYYNNIETINMLYLFRINGFENLIIRKSDNYINIKNIIKLPPAQYYC